MRILYIPLTVLLMLVASGGAFSQQAITVSVTNGRQAMVDVTVERELDLAGAARALGVRSAVDPSAVRVAEVGSSASLVSQVDKGNGGKYVVCWQIPGEFAAGQTRQFSINFSGSGDVPKPKVPLNLVATDNEVSVSSGSTTLTYSRSAGGLLRSVTINSSSFPFTWADKIYDGTVYYLATHAASSMRVLASGPLRVAYEAESDYLDDGKFAASRPRATYRFIHYAGEPLVRLDVKVKQDYAHSWISLHTAEIHFDGTPIDSYVTDQASGTLKKSGQSYAGSKWAAVYGPGIYLGIVSENPFIYDGGGQYYGAYNCAKVQNWGQTEYTLRSGIYIGSSKTEAIDMDRWSDLVLDPSKLKVSLQNLDKTASVVAGVVAKRAKALSSLKGTAWISAYARLTAARGKYQIGASKLAVGDFGAAIDALKQSQAQLNAKDTKPVVRTSKGVTVGLVNGYPFISNSLAIYLFSRPADGIGLISIYDKVKKREFLSPDISRSHLWQVAVQDNDSGRSLTNLNSGIGRVAFTERGLDLSWKSDAETHVLVTLTKDSPRLRMRLSSTIRKSGISIGSVTFPDVAGIVPITAGGKHDQMLNTWAIGDLSPSPLVTGTSLKQDYPNCMQFTGMYAEGVGLYAAEEDGQANVKTFSWNPVSSNGTLSYSVSHPVLGWGGSKRTASYVSPGDVVIGPFNGDWYDACQVYRKWALTAPWSAKGPIHKRDDYPKWLADTPYWTISDFGDETGVQREVTKFEYFGVPIGATHVYGYYFPLHQDDRYPEYTPPKLGSAGLRKVVKDLHDKGMRSVPYINGWVWDQDTESYMAEDAANKAAARNRDGSLTVMDSYGHGQKLVGMCPGAPAWQKKLVDVSKELVGLYDFDGIYYDFFTIHTTDCYNLDHGHPIAGGNFWTSSVRKTYAECRKALKKIRPDAMMTGEDNSEYVIDLLDSGLSLGKGQSQAPLFNAVYHGYTLLFGGGSMTEGGPVLQGRWWLTGNQNGWAGVEGAYPLTTDEALKRDGDYYKRLLSCHYYFARPYLAYGFMLRPPKVTSDVPKVNGLSSYGKFTLPAVDGSAWKAPDGSIGIFLLNYTASPLEFSWTADLAEYAGWGKGAKVRVTRWLDRDKTEPLASVAGGKLTREDTLEGRGILALRLEVAK